MLGSAYDEILHLLTDYADWRDGNPERSHVTALQHACQAATRAERGGFGDAAMIAALVHDAARPLSDVYHGEVIAEIMRERLADEWYFALRNHGVFQSDIVHGQRVALQWRAEPWYRAGRHLAAWDAASFDPEYPMEPLDHFLPRLEALLR